jgi:polar amino acid transport system permease protein
MFSFCADPTTIDGLLWLSCYLTTGKHMAFYLSFLVVLLLLALAAPAALLFGFAGALACRSSLPTSAHVWTWLYHHGARYP